MILYCFTLNILHIPVQVRFFILVLCPSEVKQTKSAIETGRTFATLFSDVGLRHELLEASTVGEFKTSIKKATTMFAEHQGAGAAGGHDTELGKQDEAINEKVIIEERMKQFTGLFCSGKISLCTLINRS